MDVLDALLKPKCVGKNIDLNHWANVVQPEIVRAVLRKRGLHSDELENYNSYLPEIAKLVAEHVKPQYLDPFDQLHCIEILEPHFLLPYEPQVGIDNPERALMRNHYEGQMRGIARYTIRTRAQPNAKDNQVGWVENSGEFGDVQVDGNKRKMQSTTEMDMDEDAAAAASQDAKPHVSFSEKDVEIETDNEDAANEHEPEVEAEAEAEEEEEEEDEDEEEEEEEENDDEGEEEEEEASETESEAAEDEDEENEADDTEDEHNATGEEDDDDNNVDLARVPEEDVDDDDDGDESGSEHKGRPVRHKKKKTTASTKSGKSAAASLDEFRPSVGKSRHTDEGDPAAAPTTPAFFVQKEDFSAYSNIVYECKTEHHVLDIPVWLKSRLCWMSTPFVDPFMLSKSYLLGMSYLVSRNFKICPYEEYYVNNRVLGFKNKVEIRSKFYHSSKRFRTNCTLKFTREDPKCRKNQSWYRLPRFLLEIPHETPKAFCSITVLAMAYGWSQAQFIQAIRMFLGYESTPEIEMFLTVIGLDTEECQNQHDAVRRMGKYLSKCRTLANDHDVTSYVSFTLRGEFLPNLVDLLTDNHQVENLLKGYALAEAVAELIQLSEIVNEKRPVEARWKEADRRSYCIKRVDTPGEKLTFLARKFIKHFTKKSAGALKKAVDNRKGIDMKAILNRKVFKLTGSVKNGVWDSKSDASESNQNKTQMMITGYTSDALHAQVQKFVKSAMKKNSNPEPLLTHPTQQGRVDLYLTPESDRCGIVRNKAVGCWITPLVDSTKMNEMIRRLLNRYSDKIGWVPLGDAPIFPDQRYTIVKDVRGAVMGWVQYPFELYQIVVRLRRRGTLWYLLGVEWDRRRNLFYFSADEGRLARPLIVLERMPDLIAIAASPAFLHHEDPVRLLVERGIVEYLDASEEYCGVCFVADSLQTAIRSDFVQTHMEIHGLFSFSVTVSKAFCNFNQGPRRMYTGNMVKRSISLKMFEDRGTTVSYSLMEAQDPLLSEPVDEALQLRHREPNGTNVCVAFLSDGNTNEDCYVKKKDAIERGLSVSLETMTMVVQLGANCVFAKPDSRTQGRASPDKYDGLNADGTPKVGYNFTGGMAVVGRVFLKKEGSEVTKRCLSRFLSWSQDYCVTEVCRYPNDESKPIEILRVSVSKVNRPNVGDKYFFTHGQKGTVASIRRAVDMPFFEYGPMAGLSPDLLVNVCALSRVTLGFSLEVLWGKARCLNPSAIAQYQTVFLSAQTFEEKQRICAAVLRAHGLSYTGKERMLMGETGQSIMCDIYSGFAFLGVLKQMSADKLRSRARGPNNEMTRQPTVGKKSQGGQRTGEMENKNLHSYGVTRIFQCINTESADKFTLYSCTKCNVKAIGNQHTGFYHCMVCKTRDHIVRLHNVYITELTFSELYPGGLSHSIVATVDSDPINQLADEERLIHENLGHRST